MRLKLKMVILAQYGRQKAFANSIGKYEVWLSRVIHGRVNPSTPDRIAIASALGVDDVESLFELSRVQE